MAAELAVAYISLVPSMEGITEKITAGLEPAKEAFDDFLDDLELRSAETAETVGATFDELGANISATFDSAAVDMGAAFDGVAADVDGAAANISGAVDGMAVDVDAAMADVDASLEGSTLEMAHYRDKAVEDNAEAGKSFKDSGDNAGDGMGLIVKAIIASLPAIASIAPAALGVGIGIAGMAATAIAGIGIFALASGAAATKFEADAKRMLTAWQKAMAPIVAPVYAEALKVVAAGLQAITPVVAPVSAALQRLGVSLAKALASPEVHQFFDWLGGQAAQSITSLGTFLLGAAHAAMVLGEAFSPLAKIIDDTLSGWGQSLAGFTGAGLGGFVTKLIGSMHDAGKVLGDLGSIIGSLSKVVGGAAGPLARIGVLLGGTLAKALAQSAPGLRDAVRLLGSQIVSSLRVLLPAIEPLIPMLAKFIGQIATGLAGALKLVTPLLRDVFGFLDQHPAIAQAAVDIAAVAFAFKKFTIVQTLVGWIGDLAGSFVAMGTAATGADVALDANPIGALVVVTAALSFGIYELIEHFKAVAAFFHGPLGTAIAGVISVMNPLIGLPLLVIGHWQSLERFFEGLWSWLEGAAGSLSSTFTSTWDSIRSVVVGVWQAIYSTVVEPIVTYYTVVLPAAVMAVAGAFATAWDTVRNVIVGAWHAVDSDVIQPIVEFFTATIPDATRTLSGAITSGWDTITATVKGAWLTITGAVTTGVATVESVVSGLISRLSSIATTAFGDMRAAVVAGWNAVASFVDGIPGDAAKALSALGSDIAAVATAAWVLFDSALHAGWTTVVGFLQSIPGAIERLFSGAATWLYDAGRNVVEGFISGIKSMVGSAVSAVSGLAGSVVGGAKSLLGIHSPSLVFAEIGRNIGDGMSQGISDSTSAVVDTVTKAVRAVVTGAATMAAVGAKAVTDINTGLRDGLTSLGDHLREAAADVVNAFPKSALAGVVTGMVAQFHQLESVGSSSLAGVTRRLSTARQALATIRQQVASTAQSIEGTENITSITGGSATQANPFAAPTSGDLITGLRNSVTQLRDFHQELDTLKSWGLDPAIMAQLVAAGPTQGLATAQALLQGGRKDVDLANELTAQVDAQSTAIAKMSTTAALNGKQVGESTAEGIVSGLQVQKAAIDAELLSIAEDMKTAIKQALGIRSPSTEFAEIGRNVLLGLAEGMSDHSPVESALRSVASTLIAGGDDLSVDVSNAAVAAASGYRSADVAAGGLTVQPQATIVVQSDVADSTIPKIKAAVMAAQDEWVSGMYDLAKVI